MDGRKLHHFVCFAVTMGLVACASGDTNMTSDENSNDNKAQSDSEPAVKTTPPVSSTVKSPTTKLAPKSPFTSSGPAPSSTSTPSVRTMVKPESKSCPTAKPDVETHDVETHDVGAHQKVLFLIIAGALLFTCVVLLITVTALACKVSHLRGQLSSSRSAQINGAGYWAGGREGGDVAGAGVGAAETSVMLEEVTPVQNEETAAAAEPGGAQAAADEAGRAEEADRGPTTAAAAAAGPEPAPAADPDPVENPKTQTAPAPTSEPTADKA